MDAGNLIRSGDANGLVVITQMRPISVLFTVPEAELPAVLAAMRRGKRAAGGGLGPRRSDALAEGTLQTVDNQIDTATGTIKLRAEFANTDEQLFPNQFVNMRLRVHDAARRDGRSRRRPCSARRSARSSTPSSPTAPSPSAAIALGPAEGDRVAVTKGARRPASTSCSRAWTT